MMSKIAAVSAVLAVASAASYENITLSASPVTSLSPSASCQAAFDACRGTGDPNLTVCAASSAACFGAIPTGSVGSGFVFCNAAALARGDCTVPASLTAQAMATPAPNSTVCQSQFDACRGTGDPNLAVCNAQSASCFGSIPSATAGPDVYITEVVTAYTTYCPSATTIVHGENTYTVTSATTLTITDCPCTITHPVSQPTPITAPIYTNATAAVVTAVWTTETISSTVYVCPTSTLITTVGTTITATAGQTVTVPCVTSYPATTVAVSAPVVYTNQPAAQPTTVAVGIPPVVSAPVAGTTVAVGVPPVVSIPAAGTTVAVGVPPVVSIPAAGTAVAVGVPPVVSIPAAGTAVAVGVPPVVSAPAAGTTVAVGVPPVVPVPAAGTTVAIGVSPAVSSPATGSRVPAETPLTHNSAVAQTTIKASGVASKTIATAAPSHTIVIGAAGKVAAGIQAAMIAAAAFLLA